MISPWENGINLPLVKLLKVNRMPSQKKNRVSLIFCSVLSCILLMTYTQSAEKTLALNTPPSHGEISTTHLSPISLYSLSNRFQKIKSLFTRGDTFQGIEELTELERALAQLSGKTYVNGLRKDVQNLWKGFWESEKNETPLKSDEKQLSLFTKDYPEMVSLIQNNKNLSKLMELLTQSRLKLDYKATPSDTELFSKDQTNKGQLNDRIQYAVDHQIYLSLGNGIFTTPLSGSFRRHILFKMDAQTKKIDYRSAIEIKMPGEIESKRTIDTEDFDYAQQYQNQYPDNTVTEVVLMDKLSFDGKLYGETVKDDVNVIVTRYSKSSDRLVYFIRNDIYSSIKEQARGYYQSDVDIKEDIFNKTFDLVGRMNGGLDLIGRRDMHLENFTLSQEAGTPVSVKWVNDFGDFGTTLEADHITLQPEHLSLTAPDGTTVTLSSEKAYRYRAMLRDFEKIHKDFIANNFDKKIFSREKGLVQYIRSYNKYAPENLRLNLADNDTALEIGQKKFPLYGQNSFWKIFGPSMNDPEYQSSDPLREGQRVEMNVHTAKILYDSNPEKFQEKYKTALAEAVVFFEKNRNLSGEKQIQLTAFQIAISG